MCYGTLPTVVRVSYAVPCQLAFRLATGTSSQVVHAYVVRIQTGLSEWPTSSAKAHQEFSSLALSSLSTPTIFHPSSHPPSLSSTTLFHSQPSSLPTRLFSLSLSPPPCSHVIHIHTDLSTVSGPWSICDVAQPKSRAQAQRLLEVASLSLLLFRYDGTRWLEILAVMLIWIGWNNSHCSSAVSG